jgi:hypothetical protein
VQADLCSGRGTERRPIGFLTANQYTQPPVRLESPGEENPKEKTEKV